MRTKLIFLSTVALLSVPVVVFAVDFNSIGSLIDNITTSVVKSLGYLAMSLAVVAFFFGVVQFIWAAREGDGAQMTKGKTFMLWGLIALFVMFSVWGIIKFFQGAINLPSSSEITLPTLNIGGGGGGPSAGPSTGTGAQTCSPSAPNGTCPSGLQCIGGSCIDPNSAIDN